MMKGKRVIFLFCVLVFTNKILKAQKYDTIMLPLKYEQYVMVIGLNQTVPKKSQYLGNFTFDHPVITFYSDCDGVINKAKNQARKIGGNIIKITELIEPGFPNNYCKIKADILFNDSINAIPKVPKPNQASYRLVMKDTTTFYSRVKININPTLMFGQKEYGGLFEYRVKKNLAIEIGGGANVNYTYSWETSYLGKRFVSGNGFTIRSGIRIYSKSRIYFNPAFFYRRMIYHNRYYEWGTTYSRQYEPGIMSLGCGCGGDSGYYKIIGQEGDENKQVFSFEALIGKELRWKRMTLDVYTGLGVRYKFKQKNIVSEYYYDETRGFYLLDHSSSYMPPKEERLYGYLPTVHTGFQIGFLSKQKKN